MLYFRIIPFCLSVVMLLCFCDTTQGQEHYPQNTSAYRSSVNTSRLTPKLVVGALVIGGIVAIIVYQINNNRLSFSHLE